MNSSSLAAGSPYTVASRVSAYPVSLRVSHMGWVSQKRGSHICSSLFVCRFRLCRGYINWVTTQHEMKREDGMGKCWGPVQGNIVSRRHLRLFQVEIIVISDMLIITTCLPLHHTQTNNIYVLKSVLIK